MSEDSNLPRLPEALPSSRPGRLRLSAVWIIPLVAAAVALGIAVQAYLAQGSTITVVFRSAEGIEAGKTLLRYKDVEIGRVSAVTLSPDYSRIEVKVKVAKHAAGLIVEDTRFWVVRTQVTLSGVSGLGTLLSGNYIGLDPGKSKNRAKRFVGLDAPPVVTGGEPGREFELLTDDLGSLGIGSPLYYRRLNVGQVVGYRLDDAGKSFRVKVFVNAPYDRFVLPDTRFWQASGIDLSLGANGLTLKTQSLLSVLVGGIAFESPPGEGAPEPAAPGSRFTLYPDRPTAFARAESEVRRFVLHFDESLRGLSVGAPVECLGLPVGEVTKLGLEADPATYGLRGRVEIAVYPERLTDKLPAAARADPKSRTPEYRRALVQRLIDRGMRAQLRTGSLIGGPLYVSLEYAPKASRARIDWTREPPELPVVRGGLEPLEEKVTSLLDRIGNLPLEEIAGRLKDALAAADRAAQGLGRAAEGVSGDFVPEARRALDAVRRAADRAAQVLGRVDGEVVPSARRALEELRRSADTAGRVLSDLDSGLVGPDAPARQELGDALRELARAARGIRLLADYLERNPGALIRGKTEEKP